VGAVKQAAALELLGVLEERQEAAEYGWSWIWTGCRARAC
jgi:hypothetical protein